MTMVTLVLLPALVATPAFASPAVQVINPTTQTCPPSIDDSIDGPQEYGLDGDPDDAIIGNKGKPVINNTSGVVLPQGMLINELLDCLYGMAASIVQAVAL